jgi:hypothetical protein
MDLPLEIRLQTWSLASFRKPKFFRLTHTLRNMENGLDELHINCTVNGWHYELCDRKLELPATFSVTRESRDQTLEHFKPMLELTRPGTPLIKFPDRPYFNVSLDTFEIDYGYKLWWGYQKLLNILKDQAPESIKAIQNLLILTVPGRPNVNTRFAADFKTLIETFTGLRTLKVLVLGDILDYHVEGYKIEIDNLLKNDKLDIEIASTSSW